MTFDEATIDSYKRNALEVLSNLFPRLRSDTIQTTYKECAGSFVSTAVALEHVDEIAHDQSLEPEKRVSHIITVAPYLSHVLPVQLQRPRVPMEVVVTVGRLAQDIALLQTINPKLNIRVRIDIKKKRLDTPGKHSLQKPVADKENHVVKLGQVSKSLFDRKLRSASAR